MALLLAAALPITVLSVPAPARAAAAHIQTSQARLGGRLGRRAPTTRYRYPTRSYPRTYRRSPFHGFGSTVLKALGIAYLAHMLFGWGAGGGSPFGLLLLFAIVLFLATRRRRRVTYF